MKKPQFINVKTMIFRLLLLSITATLFSPIVRSQENDEDFKAWQDCNRVCVPNKYDDFLSGPGTAERLERAKQISGILEELEGYRQDFLRTGDFKDLFPAVYYQITKLEMDAIMSGQMARPTENMDMMMRFYDSYQANRRAFEAGGSSSVEPHWKLYYDEAQKANQLLGRTDIIAQGKIFLGIKTVLGEGIRAHVKFDLPRAIRNITGGNQSLASQMQADFQKTNSFFSKANSAANSDIANALFPGSKTANPLFLTPGGAFSGVSNEVTDVTQQSCICYT